MFSTTIPLAVLMRTASTRRVPVRIPEGADGSADTDIPETDEPADEDDGGESGGAPEDTGTVSKEDYDKLRSDFDKMRAQLSAADRNKSAAERRLEELDRKDKSDLENAQADAVKFQKESTSWQAKYTSLALTNAFLAESMRLRIQWHNPTLALRAEDTSALTVDEDGNVAGIAEYVKKLAKDQPYLVNSARAEDEDTEDEPKRRPASGSAVGGGAKKQKTTNGQLSEEELIRRFPALKR